MTTTESTQHSNTFFTAAPDSLVMSASIANTTTPTISRRMSTQQHKIHPEQQDLDNNSVSGTSQNSLVSVNKTPFTMVTTSIVSEAASHSDASHARQQQIQARSRLHSEILDGPSSPIRTGNIMPLLSPVIHVEGNDNNDPLLDEEAKQHKYRKLLMLENQRQIKTLTSLQHQVKHLRIECQHDMQRVRRQIHDIATILVQMKANRKATFQVHI